MILLGVTLTLAVVLAALALWSVVEARATVPGARAPIAGASPGQVTLSGTIRATEAPLDTELDRKAVAVHVIVERRQSIPAKKQLLWVEEASTSRTVAARLEDASGSVEVDLGWVNLTADVFERESTSHRESIALLGDGARVTVRGTLTAVDRPKGGAYREAERALVLGGSESRPLEIVALDREVRGLARYGRPLLAFGVSLLLFAIASLIHHLELSIVQTGAHDRAPPASLTVGQAEVAHPREARAGVRKGARPEARSAPRTRARVRWRPA